MLCTWIGSTPGAQPAGLSFSPLDEELGLLPGTLSPTLQEDLVRLSTWLPFGRAAAELGHFQRVPVSETTATRLTEAFGAAAVAVQTADEARIEQEQMEAPVGAAMQQVSADGAFVPLLKGHWAEVKTLVIGTLDRTSAPDHPTVPKATDLSYFSRMVDADRFSHQATVETFARGTARAEVVAAVMDGATWLQGFVDLQRPDAVRILDFSHAVSYLADAAQATWGADTPATQAWVAQQRHTLAHALDGAEQVLQAVRELPVSAASDPVQAATQQAITLGYLGKRVAQMRYAEFIAQGYPIGSGAVESANKLVVEARLKGSGMHWAAAHVDPLLALRTIVCSDRWAAQWPRVAQERRAEAARHQAEQRKQRRTHRTLRTAPSVAPTVQLTVPSIPAPPGPLLGRRKTVIHGRPTAAHPWRLHPLNLQRRPRWDDLPPQPNS